MYDANSIPRRSAARLLMSPFAALYAIAPASAFASPDPDAQEKVQAEKVAQKLEKAKDKSHEAKEEREAIRHFKEEIAEYVELHNKEVAKIPEKDLATLQKTLAPAIVAKRRKAQQGDIFIREVQPFFKRLIGEQLKGPDSRSAQKAVTEGNPGHDEDSAPITVKVNGAYPRGAARSTVPASVLAALPPLPESLQYLFVGRDLILVDAVAQLIVDFLPAAAPELIK